MANILKSLFQAIWERPKGRYIFLAIVIGLPIVYGVYKYSTFHFNRAWNWKMGGYESRTQEEICDMVKPEFLTTMGVEICNDR